MASRPQTYNERLFGGGLRGWYHRSRFNWAHDVVRKLPPGLKVVELGCYDGRILDEIGSRVTEYVGVDANWAGGLDLARDKLEGRSGVRLIESADPHDLGQFRKGHFDLGIALETLEHVPPTLMTRYLDELARITRGHLLVSVPNELGPIFLAKYLAKLALWGDVQPYKVREVIAATFRRSDLVERDDHKGFDYRSAIAEIASRFEILSIKGLPGTGLPPALSPTVAIFARSRAA